MMKNVLRIGAMGAALTLAGGSAMAQTATPVKTMLDGVNTATIATEIGTWGGAAVAVFLAIAAIPLAKRLLSAVMGR